MTDDNGPFLSDGFLLRLRLSEEARFREAFDRRTESGEWLSQLIWTCNNVGHPDDLARARAVLSLPTWEANEYDCLLEWLERMEVEGRRIIGELEKVGWTYHHEGVGKGSLKPIHDHEVHGKGKGIKKNYLAALVWALCYAEEQAVRATLKEPDPPWAKYRVSGDQDTVAEIARRLQGILPPEYYTHRDIKGAIDSWHKRNNKLPPKERGSRPSWMPNLSVREMPLAE